MRFQLAARTNGYRDIVSHSDAKIARPDFEDPDYPGQRFYWWHCALLEGVLVDNVETLGTDRQHPLREVQN